MTDGTATDATTDAALSIGATWVGDRWVAIAFSGRSFRECSVVDELGELWLTYGEAAERILIDVPVGLPADGTATRECDALARAVLGSRADVLASPPVREATRKRRFQAAERVHERHTGEPLSEAAFDRAAAIVAVEDLFAEASAAWRIVLESHPELCFRAFAGAPLAHPREHAAGYAERLRTLAEFDRDAPPTVQEAAEETAGHPVSVHDVLDAAALAYTVRPGPGSLRSLPPDPPTSEEGFPMRLVYRSAEPLVDA